ncbi:MAG: NRAMP family divalent metal transporter [Saprospiraceae bacterium]
MPKTIPFRKGLSSVLFWSVISAAFIGPGTVTTASSAGAAYQLHLLWALTFSTLATILLQEASARITIASGKSLGEIIALQYVGRSGQQLKIGLFLAVAFGCAAYEAGNILGAVSGLLFLITGVPKYVFTLGLGVFCATLLWTNNFQFIARAMGIVVFLMGIAFIWVAVQIDFTAIEFFKGALLPTFPAGASLLIIGLIGTTIVPYNLFLASGIGQGQDIKEMRIGIAIAVLLGGIISMAILMAGTLVEGTYSYEALTQAMSTKLGNWAVLLFGFGLFAAGMSSAITAPLAAAVTGRSLLGFRQDAGMFRVIWMIVLGVGLFFGLTEIRPIPAIILAQAINGVLLPIVAIFLLLAVNDQKLLPKDFRNTFWANILMLLIVGVATILGLTNVGKALGNFIPVLNEKADVVLWVDVVLTIGIVALLGKRIFWNERVNN